MGGQRPQRSEQQIVELISSLLLPAPTHSLASLSTTTPVWKVTYCLNLKIDHHKENCWIILSLMNYCNLFAQKPVVFSFLPAFRMIRLNNDHLEPYKVCYLIIHKIPLSDTMNILLG